MTMKWLSFIVLLSAFSAEAQTINAASCSSSAVQTALNSVAADGTTVLIPSCSATSWTSTVTYNQVYSTIIQGQTTVTGTCAPGGTCTATDNTIITDNVSGTALTINTASGKSFRMTGLTFNPSSSTAAYGAIDLQGGSTSVRVDHNHFNDTVGGDHTFNVDAVNGVFDHNFFDSTNQSNLFFVQPTNNGADGNANTIWTVPDNFGTSSFIFFENNFFQNGAFVFDCDFGGRLVFRYNTGWYNTRIQTHGVGSGAQRRGCRTMEVYENTFTYSSTPNTNSFAFLVDYESGTAMWWGNTMTAFTTFLREDVVRTNNATYNQTANPNGWGYCGSSMGSSNWDGNTNSTGYPCLDNIGRGAGQLLTGTFPNLVNSSKGTIVWPDQALVPVYAWNNTLNTNSYAPNHYWQNYDTVSVENRDYYLQLPNTDETATFNGSAGVGQGLLSARPSTCAPVVAYWATDTTTLYQCSATNTWTAYYTPYTYPHPLTQGSAPPLAPTAFQAVVH
jgi:hypothetical protein